jgi:hypothetical protein
MTDTPTDKPLTRDDLRRMTAEQIKALPKHQVDAALSAPYTDEQEDA